jgi:hypothetical protein
VRELGECAFRNSRGETPKRRSKARANLALGSPTRAAVRLVQKLCKLKQAWCVPKEQEHH